MHRGPPATQSGARGTVLGKGERWRIDVEPPSCIDAHFLVTMPGGGLVERPFWACGTNVFDGNWHHIVVTYDRDGNGTIYVDGTVATGNYDPMSIADLAAGSVDSDWQVRMGHRTLNESGSATRSPFRGTIDEVSIYNEALSATDVANRYRDQASVGKYQYYMMARYQDPAYGRFTQPDYWEPGFLTPQALTPLAYVYVNSNPLVFVDPTGHFCWGCLKKPLLVTGIIVTASLVASTGMIAVVGGGVTLNPALVVGGAIMLGTAIGAFKCAFNIAENRMCYMPPPRK